MEQKDDPQQLERQIEQVTRLASTVTDQTTLERFMTYAGELRNKLRRALERRAIRNRAREIWEENGRPEGRDEEFWLRAEQEVSNRES
jgi:hypothetical protein